MILSVTTASSPTPTLVPVDSWMVWYGVRDWVIKAANTTQSQVMVLKDGNIILYMYINSALVASEYLHVDHLI